MNKHINFNCIAPSIAGRLGNNMFMIAHAYAKALDQNKQLIVSRRQVSHMQDFENNIFRKLDLYVDTLNELPEESVTVYSGYFQSESYFEKYSEAVKQLFSPSIEFIEKVYNDYHFLKDSKVTAISVRRGDYLMYNRYHPIVSKEYLEVALSKISNSDYNLVFTDDLLWCKENLSHIHNVHFIDAPIHEQMWLMSLCDNFIISNSSFSWWGAYLSRNLNKVVIAPEIWYGPDGPKQWEEIYCKGWTKLSSHYKDGYIYPSL
jgi:hypothetical protein